MPPAIEEDKSDCVVIDDDLYQDEFDDSVLDSYVNQEDVAQQIPGSASLDALAALPVVRSVPWKPGKELPPDKSTESPRYQTRGGCLLAMRGHVMEPRCSHCASPGSRLSLCVSLPGWYRGSCAACQMRAKGAQCSLRQSVARMYLSEPI